jgi:hypothetical protein
LLEKIEEERYFRYEKRIMTESGNFIFELKDETKIMAEK